MEVLIMNNLKKRAMKLIANAVYSCAKMGANSTCHSLFGQIKEPESLSVLKKYK